MTTRGAVLEASDRPIFPETVAVLDRSANLTRSERTRAARNRRRSTRRRASISLVGASALLLAAVAVGDSVRERDEGPAAGGATSAAAVHTTLLAIQGDDGQAASVIVLALGQGGADSTAVMVPGALEIEAPGLDRQPVSALTALGGASTLRLGMENLLGVRVDRTAVVPAEIARAALTRLAPLAITLRNPLDLSAIPGGRAFSDGAQSVSAEEAWILLTAIPPGGERDHLDAARAVLTAWASGAATSGLVIDEVAAIARSKASFQTLPVNPSGVGDVERFTLDRPAASVASKRWFPGALRRLGGSRPLVEIRNGSGAVGVTQQAAMSVVPLGVQVTLTGNVSGFGVANSEVLYYRSGDSASAHAIAKALRIKRVSRVAHNVNVVDVTILLGSDFTPRPTASSSVAEPTA